MHGKLVANDDLPSKRIALAKNRRSSGRRRKQHNRHFCSSCKTLKPFFVSTMPTLFYSCLFEFLSLIRAENSTNLFVTQCSRRYLFENAEQLDHRKNLNLLFAIVQAAQQFART